MKIVRIGEIKEEERRSPKGKYLAYYREISGAFGSHPRTDIPPKHPFDLMLARIPPGKTYCPYHAHAAQWEMYVVLAGAGMVRDDSGKTPVAAGDTFVFAPGEAHQISNEGTEDFIYYVIADNPVGECVYYPDSDKWAVRMAGERKILNSTPVDYHLGEE